MNEEYLASLKGEILGVEYDTALCKQFVVMGGTCLRDGNMFGAVIGGLPEGCAAFEKTRSKAILRCMHNFYNEEAKIPGKKDT